VPGDFEEQVAADKAARMSGIRMAVEMRIEPVMNSPSGVATGDRRPGNTR